MLYLINWNILLYEKKKKNVIRNLAMFITILLYNVSEEDDIAFIKYVFMLSFVTQF